MPLSLLPVYRCNDIICAAFCQFHGQIQKHISTRKRHPTISGQTPLLLLSIPLHIVYRSFRYSSAIPRINNRLLFFQAGEADENTSDSVFMDLDELCGTTLSKAEVSASPAVNTRPAAMEKLIHELISDRLLTLSRYITLDSSSRTILIDQTSLSADGYRIVTH